MTSGTTVFPCQNCGSTMAWDPAAGMMACGHCGNRQAVTLTGTAVREHAFAELARLPAKPVAKLGPAFICPNCGARTESDLLSANCQFCGTRSSLILLPSNGSRPRQSYRSASASSRPATR
jgi:DNA-directed RNA polymerase subunit RPC12/RpoP